MATRQHRRTLTVRQQAFAEALAQGKSQAEAGQLAGYANDAAALSRTAHKPQILDYVKERQELAKRSQEWTLEWWRGEIAATLVDAANAGDIPSRFRGLELAGRHIGAFEPSPDSTAAARQDAILAALTSVMARQLESPPRSQELTARDTVYRVLDAGNVGEGTDEPPTT